MVNNIISPVLGAVIGYFTNWLAIKMLFLPYEAKYIGRFKIPFTPGLIPKERKKLASKIASVTEEKILNKETIEKNLFTDKNKEKVYLLIEKNFQALKDKDYTINDILEKICDDKEQIVDNIEKNILEKIYNFIFDEKNQEKICSIILEKIYKLIENDEIKEKVILNIINNEKFKENIYNLSLCDIIEKEKISNFKIVIFENIPKICNYIANKIENDKDIELKLKTFVKSLIEENVGTFTGLFLNSDKIYNSIKKNIILYLKNKENQNVIGLKVFEQISLYQDKKLLEIYEKLPENTKHIIKEKVTEDSIKKYINKIKIDNTLCINLDDFVKKIFKENISKRVYLLIENYIKNNRDILLNFKINVMLNKIDIYMFKDKIFNITEKFIDKEGDKILAGISISDMIEDKINSFDMETIENLIVSVTKKELNAITIIGGVLGFVIGLIPVILK